MIWPFFAHSHRDRDYDCWLGTEIRPRSGGVPVVVPQQTTESLATLNVTISEADFVPGVDYLVVEPLMIALDMVVFQELPDGGTQHLLPEEDHP